LREHYELTTTSELRIPRTLHAYALAVWVSPRTGTPRDEAVRRFGALRIDPQSRKVHLDGVAVALTRTEFDILDALSARPRLAFSRAQLIEAVWGGGWVGDEHLVDIHVGHIRRKLGDDPTNPRYVLTVRGVGYRMGTG
jgi:DNA-binding response OmpR family regulator